MKPEAREVLRDRGETWVLVDDVTGEPMDGKPVDHNPELLGDVLRRSMHELKGKGGT